jgi:hypothetical protein
MAITRAKSAQAEDTKLNPISAATDTGKGTNHRIWDEKGSVLLTQRMRHL